MARPFDQVSIKSRRLGPEPGTAKRELLFLHGAWHGSWCWGPLAEPLALDGYGVTMIDLPGHGENTWELPALTSINDYAAYAARAASELPSPVLIGHSMGGWVVQKLLEVVDLPSVLLCPLPAKGLAWRTLGKLAFWHPILLGGTFIGRPFRVKNAAMARQLFYDKISEDELHTYWEPLVPEPAIAALQMGLFFKLPFINTPMPKPGREPRLVIAAENDWIMPVGAMRHAAKKLGARFELLPDMPHNPWLEDEHGVVLQHLRDFLSALEQN